ncbi:Glycosyl hydrolases family 18 [Popillia japonica]|uniref:Glycosyl hydrolases family 18 n=1 Tax=Popillia japonica TaxID=7064 RepID=A0AAW1L885_POPJA
MWKGYIILAAVIVTALAATDKLVCYHGTWANYRPGDCRYTIENINTTLCTQVIYAFMGLSGCSIRLLDAWLDVDLGALKRMTGLRSKNPDLKALAAIGGWNEGSTSYSTMVGSASCRKTFIDSVVKFMETYGFDGFDLDWEYPSQRGGAAADKNNFSTLLAEMKAAFGTKYMLTAAVAAAGTLLAEMKAAFGTKYMLTAAVAAAGASVDISYDVPKLSQYLDQIHVMTYDLHGAWDGVTGHNAPLYASSKDVTETTKQLNVHACIQGWIKRGADPKKIIMGVGTYGRSFTLADANKNGIGATSYNGGSAGRCTREASFLGYNSYNGGSAGRCTREASFLGYNEICENIAQGGWTVVWDAEQQVPYAYKGNQWVGYDNPASMELKAQYAQYYGLGGVMVWSLETDDFNGKCGEKDALLKALKRTLDRPEITTPSNELEPTEDIKDETTESTKEETTEGTKEETTEDTKEETTEGTKEETTEGIKEEVTEGNTQETTTSGSICTGVGYARDPVTCTVFYQCVAYRGSYIAYPLNCPSGLYFDLSSNVCNWPYLVPDCKK